MFNPKLHSPGVSLCGLGANPGVNAFGSLLCSERFFSRYSGFLLSLKTNAFKFQFDLEGADTFQRVLKIIIIKCREDHHS